MGPCPVRAFSAMDGDGISIARRMPCATASCRRRGGSVRPMQVPDCAAVGTGRAAGFDAPERFPRPDQSGRAWILFLRVERRRGRRDADRRRQRQARGRCRGRGDRPAAPRERRQLTLPDNPPPAFDPLAQKAAEAVQIGAEREVVHAHHLQEAARLGDRRSREPEAGEPGLLEILQSRVLQVQREQPVLARQARNLPARIDGDRRPGRAPIGNAAPRADGSCGPRGVRWSGTCRTN